MTGQNCIYSALAKAEKGEFGASTLSHKMCPRKQTTETNLLILVSFFSGEDTSYYDTSYCIHILWEVCRSVFLGHPVYIYITSRKPILQFLAKSKTNKQLTLSVSLEVLSSSPHCLSHPYLQVARSWPWPSTTWWFSRSSRWAWLSSWGAVFSRWLTQPGEQCTPQPTDIHLLFN